MNDVARFKKELLAREYGRNVVNIVQEIAKNPDKAKRTEQSKLLIKLIEKMNPSVRYAENAEEILWGHLYIMSDMQLDVDVDYKKPTIEITKPQKVGYPDTKPKYKHYGKNVDVLGEELSKLSDDEDKKEAAISFGKLLKTLYSNWNSNSVGDQFIAKNVKELSKGNLVIDPSMLEDDGNSSLFYTKKRGGGRSNSSSSSNNNNNNNKGGRNNNRNRGRRRSN